MSEEKKVQAQGAEETKAPVQALDDIEMLDVEENLKKYEKALERGPSPRFPLPGGSVPGAVGIARRCLKNSKKRGYRLYHNRKIRIRQGFLWKN